MSSWVNFNPRTPRGVRHIPARPVIEPAIISIHAPREGCDWALSGEGACITPFQSTHPARGATFSNCIQLESFVFQSTHPARGATWCIRQLYHLLTYFNPRTPRGVRLVLFYRCINCLYFNPRTPRGVRPSTSNSSRARMAISIHAPREGCDWAPDTYPAGWKISIHAPREGCDSSHCFHIPSITDFNPRTPRGVRHMLNLLA